MKNSSLLAKKYFNGKLSIIAVLLILLAVFTVSGTLAYLIVTTDSVTNTFVPGSVTCAVEETFDGTTKSDVKVKNTGNVDAYIRAAVVVNWVDADGNVCAQAHTAPTISYNDTDWTKGADGYWYYKEAVAPGALTNNLINTATSTAQADGCKLQIEIIASAIQAEGTGATGAADAWGKVPAGN